MRGRGRHSRRPRLSAGGRTAALLWWRRPAAAGPRGRPGADPSPGCSRGGGAAGAARADRPDRGRPDRGGGPGRRARVTGHPVHRGEHLAGAPRPDQQRRPPDPADHVRRGLVRGQPAPGLDRVGRNRRAHRLRNRAGGLLPALPVAARGPGLREPRGRDARGLPGVRSADVREGRLSDRRRVRRRSRPGTAAHHLRRDLRLQHQGRTSATRSSSPRKSANLPRPIRTPATTLVTWPVTSIFTRTTRSPG